MKLLDINVADFLPRHAQKRKRVQRCLQIRVISSMTASGLVVYSQNTCSAFVPRTRIFKPPLTGMNLRCSAPDLIGVMTPRAIFVTCSESLAASTAGTALEITVECRPLNFGPFRRPLRWLTKKV